jgi:phosphatidylethanolamine-binding protein (PEBP) family uncharacterized protein
MARTRKATLVTPAALATIAIVVLAGCGGSKETTTGQVTTSASTPTNTAPTRTSAASTPASTPSATSTTTKAPAQEEKAPTQEKVDIRSPVVKNEGVLPSRYTCDGQGTPLPLRWKGIPPDTQELMLDIIKINPVNGKLYFDWAVMGLKPSSTGIGPGSLPAGAIVGSSSDGHTSYTLCPPKGPKESYVAVLFALPHSLRANTGFDPAVLRRQANNTAKYEGLLVFSYQRH